MRLFDRSCKLGPVGAETDASTQAGTPRVQSTKTNSLNVNAAKQECTDWYIVYYIDGVYWYDEYLTTTCRTVDDGQGDGSSGSGPPPPAVCPQGYHPGPPVTPPCIPVLETSVKNVETNTVNIFNATPPPPVDGGGMPPPPKQQCSKDPERAQCPPTEVINNVKDPCLKNVIEAMLNKNIEGKISDIINNVFDSNDQVKLFFNEFNDVNSKPTKTDPPTLSNGIFNEKIYLNLAQLKDASKEFKTIITVHEVLHAYMNYKTGYANQLRQHQEMAEKYVTDIKNYTQQLYPISDPDAYAIILNGLSDVFGDNKPLYLNTLKNKYNVSDPLGTYELQRT